MCVCVGSVCVSVREFFGSFFVFCFLAKGFLRQLGDGGARVKRRVCVAARATWVRASSVGQRVLWMCVGQGSLAFEPGGNRK